MKAFFCFSVMILFILTSCKKDDNNVTNPENQQNTVTDIDGNVYHTVRIGTQIWMVENLKVTKYRNGDAIPKVTSDYEWKNTGIGAYCNYDNAQSPTIYGSLYNGYAVNDPRNIAPVGWHIPSKAEWETLINNLGIKSLIGGNLKEAGTSHWKSPNEGADNSSGFTALPGGRRGTSNFSFGFSDIGMSGYWWPKGSSYYFSLSYYSKEVTLYDPPTNLTDGMSVRCLKD